MSSPTLTPEQVAGYDASRPLKSAPHVCLAPFNNMYFSARGRVSSCWLSIDDGRSPKYPDQSIHDIWFGDWFNGFRSRIANRDLSDLCQVCDRNIKNGVYQSALSRIYDNPAPLGSYPRGMEFELSNLCNLECIMCKGYLSSTIRRKRDLLPAIESPYDSVFVEQLEEFIPHLTDMRFNGGEPTLQKICREIWQKVATLKPDVTISVTTNGTNLDEKLRKIFERGRFQFLLSIDSLAKANYESIRRGSSYDKVMANLEWYDHYSRSRNGNITILVNPMRMNWRELPNYVEFCSRRDFALGLNTVWRPYSLALWTLPSRELEKIHSTLSQAQFSPEVVKTRLFNHNLGAFRNFVDGQVRTWAREQAAREEQSRDYSTVQAGKKDAKERFRAKLVKELQGDRLADLERKVEECERRVASNVSREDYYGLLEERAIDVVISKLEQGPTTHTIEWIYRAAQYY